MAYDVSKVKMEMLEICYIEPNDSNGKRSLRIFVNMFAKL